MRPSSTATSLRLATQSTSWASGSSQEADRAGLLLLPVKCAQALPPGKGRLACASVRECPLDGPAAFRDG